jgi:DNA-binding Xre family transcriptional regulator
MKLKISYDRLWKLMIDKKINKTQLIQEAEITSNAMAKLGKNETVQVDVLLKICEVLQCGINDVIELIEVK